MRKFRILFSLFAVALLLPIVLLVRRAVDSVDLERRMRHETIAERVFDEMERALSTELAREEERPFGQYSFYWAAPGQLGGTVALTRSPLAEPPARPFVVGYFQVDPDGSLHTPLTPRDGERPLGAPAWQPTAETLAAVAAIEDTVGSYWRGGRPAPQRDRAAAPQLPGTTVMLEPSAPEEKRDERAGQDEVSAFDALRALNKGIEQRASRQAKLSREYPVDAAAVEVEKSEGAVERDDAYAAPPLGDRSRDTRRTNVEARLELSPMVGHAIDARHMLLYRTVVRESQGYRQGLLLEVEKLGGWLRSEAFGADGLARHATLDFSTPFAPVSTPDPTSPFVYRHRFAEPFDDLTARLALGTLPGVGGGTYVYALATLLLAAGVLGLAALYRMVSVVLSFAERRSNFAAAVSHELKTPLTAIRMYGEMLRDGMVASEAKRDEYHRHITAESERLSRLINNVLEFSRLEKHTRQVALVTGDIAPVVEEAAALLRPHAEREGFELQVDVAHALPPVRFERDALLQVLFNLVDNAVKYGRDSELRRITIGGRADGAGVHLVVRDHGPGVPSRHLTRIFEPFFRGESELTRRRTGTGLGLALVRGLVTCMGARVSGRNAPGGGFEVDVLFAPAA